MKRIILPLPLLLILSLTSCSEKDDPTPEPATTERLSAIIGNNQTIEFTYDDFGNVTRWTNRYSDANIQTNYTYSNSGTIKMVTLYTTKPVQEFPEEKTIYDETLHLGDNGLAEYTEGVCTLYRDMDPIMKKKFRIDFSYNDLSQLTAIRFSEWRPAGDGWEESPWTWENTLEWESGNMVRYTDYQGNSKPDQVSEYKYYGGITVTDNPVVNPVIRSEYTPLQLAGYFGRQSREQVKEVTTTGRSGSTRTEKYTYSFSTSLNDTRIESFTKTVNNGSVYTFIVVWK